MTGVVKAVAHGASPRQNHAGYLPTRAWNDVDVASTPYERAADRYHGPREYARTAGASEGEPARASRSRFRCRAIAPGGRADRARAGGRAGAPAAGPARGIAARNRARRSSPPRAPRA